MLIMFGVKDKKEINWASAQKLISKLGPGEFIQRLVAYDFYELRPQVIELLEPIVSQPEFNKQTIMKRSEAAGLLCSYVVNFVKI